MADKHMKVGDVLRAGGGLLRGRRPLLSIEITRECPLRCPGCYAYEPGHLDGAGPLRELADLKGEALVAGVLGLVRRYRPLHISIVGGEPLVRHRDLDVLLPKLAAMGLYVQLVTSAVRPIPLGWDRLPNFHLVVSIDGLRPEHDRRRAPATYDRILKHIVGHRITVHCTITRQQVQRAGYLEEFAAFWSERMEVRKIWFSLYTPQQGDASEERLRPHDRVRVAEELARLSASFPKVDIPRGVMEGYLKPPASPHECLFAQATTCVSADLTTRITPCQFGGRPVCAECGCMASAGLTALGRLKVAGVVPISELFRLSVKVGERFNRAARQFVVKRFFEPGGAGF